MGSTSIWHSYSCFNTIVKNQCGQKLQNYPNLTTRHGQMSRVHGTSVPNPILDCKKGLDLFRLIMTTMQLQIVLNI